MREPQEITFLSSDGQTTVKASIWTPAEGRIRGVVQICHGMVEHMRKHADIMRPKFEAVIEILERELGGLGIGSWTSPKGGYFISFDSLDGCAKSIVGRCKKAGLIMTGAGATYPYGKDPHDCNIRIAPTYPTLGDLIMAAELFTLCVKLSSVEKLLKTMA